MSSTIGFDGVKARVLKALGAAGAALVNEDEAVSAGQRKQVRQEVVVAGAGTAMEDDERGAGAEGHVIDEDAVGVNEALLLGVDGGGGLGGAATAAARAKMARATELISCQL